MITVDYVKERTPERFWLKIKFGGIDDCWTWLRGTDRRGYGQYSIKPDLNKPNKSIRATRFIFKSVFGDFDSRLYVCHTCDNPVCVNPNHLWVGTTQQNTKDRDIKDRTMKGERHYKASISESDAIKIREYIHQGQTQEWIALKFGVSRYVVNGIKNGRSWKHLGGKILDGRNRKKLTEENVIDIKTRIANNETDWKIAKLFNVNSAAIYAIRHGITWKYIKLTNTEDNGTSETKKATAVA